MPDETQYFKPGVPIRPQRVSLQVAVRYRSPGDESWKTGRTENISRTGVLVRAVRLLPLNAEVEVAVTVPAGIIPDLAGPIVCSGTVARLVPAVAGGSPGIGIAFTSCRAASA
jgi:hypothetical protein